MAAGKLLHESNNESDQADHKQSLVSAQHRCLLSLASVASKVGFLFTEQQPRSGYAATSYSDWACCTPRRTRRMSPPPKSQ